MEMACRLTALEAGASTAGAIDGTALRTTARRATHPRRAISLSWHAPANAVGEIILASMRPVAFVAVIALLVTGACADDGTPTATPTPCVTPTPIPGIDRLPAALHLDEFGDLVRLD